MERQTVVTEKAVIIDVDPVRCRSGRTARGGQPNVVYGALPSERGVRGGHGLVKGLDQFLRMMNKQSIRLWLCVVKFQRKVQ